MTLAQHHIDTARQKLELAAVHGDPVTLTGAEVKAILADLSDETSLHKKIKALERELDENVDTIDKLEAEVELLQGEISELNEGDE